MLHILWLYFLHQYNAPQNDIHPEERLNSSQIHLNGFEEFSARIHSLECLVHCAPTNFICLFSTIFSFQRCPMPYYLSLPAPRCTLYSVVMFASEAFHFNCIEVRALIIEQEKWNTKRRSTKNLCTLWFYAFVKNIHRKKYRQRPKRLDETKADLRSIYLLSNKLNKNKPTNGEKELWKVLSLLFWK